jgi:hypothetical protein
MMQYKGGDQDFLKRYIYPLIDVEHELISHDSYHCLEFASTKAWPIRRKVQLCFVTSRVLPCAIN